MAAGTPGAMEGLLLGALVCVLAIWQGWGLARRWGERQGLGPGMEEDYLRWRWRRRFLATVIMGLVGVGLIVGVRIPHKGTPAQGGLYVAWWTGVVFLLLALVVLAMWDMVANLQYGKHSRKALYRQQVEWLRSQRPGWRPGESGENGLSSMDDEVG